jgi:hypothetical protein
MSGQPTGEKDHTLDRHPLCAYNANCGETFEGDFVIEMDAQQESNLVLQV